MESLLGLPNFQEPIATDGLQMYRPFGAGSYSVLPQRLVVAQTPGGKPKFTLSIVKSGDDLKATGRYAALALELAGDFPVDQALERARKDAPEATVSPATIHSGFARFYSTSAAVTLPADMAQAVPLGWTGPDFVRWTTRLSVDAGELIKGVLSGGAMLFGARVEFDILGVSPRLQATVEFQPVEMIEKLLAGAQERQIASADLVRFFTRPLDGLPLNVVGAPDPEILPQAMADRVVAAYGSMVPSPSPTDPPFIAFKPIEEIESGTVTWDLGEAIAVPRQFAMTLDPLTSLRAAAGGSDLDALVREIVVPPLDLGFRSIDLAANIPCHRIGVPAIGVNIAIPGNPPSRPNAISETISFAPPDDEGSVKFRLAPEETLSYTLASFAVITAGASVREYQMPPRPLSASWMQLQATDFPVTFAHLTASDRLLRLAKLTGLLSYSIDGKTWQQPIGLSADAPDVAVAVPAGASDASIALSALPSDSGACLPLLPIAPGRTRLDVTSFREYGPHRISIQCEFETGSAPLSIDLVPEDRASDGSAVSTITLLPAAPGGTWGYVASSPFRAGYRYRKSASPGDAPNTWSAVLSPFAPLVLQEDGTMAKSASAGGISFDIDGNHFYWREDRPDTLYYLPGAPVPELDAQGRPTLMLLQMAQSAILQLGVQFTLTPAARSSVLTKIALQRPALGGAGLQPAPITVQKAAVSMADTSGKVAELKSTVSSGFPPYAAIFSIALTPDQAAQATAAINGRAGLLFVDYVVSPPASVAATLEGWPATLTRRTDVAGWFAAGEGRSHLRLAG